MAPHMAPHMALHTTRTRTLAPAHCLRLGGTVAALRGTLTGRGDHAALAWLAVSASDDVTHDRAALAARSRMRQAFLASDTGPPAPPAGTAR